MDLNEKCNVHGDDFKNRLLTILTINKAEGGSMEFYMDLNEKCNVHGDDFKNPSLYVIFNDKGKRNWVTGILQWIE
ncbi:hypothetical protein T4A_3666 [Trichinella pseudospiralis]|uniref:Uncharacterized protein n=1 Tax=Trichinella pseudospiralis TaxID=6337 RepID=A0A0V1DPQ1_TRIPS|nr:hypothetical protein T4A_3666 [Trichinella pseudospiralis]